MDIKTERRGRGKKLARFSFCVSHLTHFNGCVPCHAFISLYGVGQDRRRTSVKERRVFFISVLFTSYGFRGLKKKRERNFRCTEGDWVKE